MAAAHELSGLDLSGSRRRRSSSLAVWPRARRISSAAVELSGLELGGPWRCSSARLGNGPTCRLPPRRFPRKNRLAGHAASWFQRSSGHALLLPCSPRPRAVVQPPSAPCSPRPGASVQPPSTPCSTSSSPSTPMYPSAAHYIFDSLATSKNAAAAADMTRILSPVSTTASPPSSMTISSPPRTSPPAPAPAPPRVLCLRDPRHRCLRRYGPGHPALGRHHGGAPLRGPWRTMFCSTSTRSRPAARAQASPCSSPWHNSTRSSVTSWLLCRFVGPCPLVSFPHDIIDSQF